MYLRIQAGGRWYSHGLFPQVVLRVEELVEAQGGACHELKTSWNGTAQHRSMGENQSWLARYDTSIAMSSETNPRGRWQLPLLLPSHSVEDNDTHVRFYICINESTWQIYFTIFSVQYTLTMAYSLHWRNVDKSITLLCARKWASAF